MNPNETYVSIDTAKLLKEAGFDLYVDQYYGSKPYINGVLAVGYRGDLRKADAEWRLDKELTSCWYKNREEELGYAAPTLAVAQRWLREVKNMSVEVLFEKPEKWSCGVILDTNKGVSFENFWREEFDYDIYEQALEAGIKKALEVILEKGEIKNTNTDIQEDNERIRITRNIVKNNFKFAGRPYDDTYVYEIDKGRNLYIIDTWHLDWPYHFRVAIVERCETGGTSMTCEHDLKYHYYFHNERNFKYVDELQSILEEYGINKEIVL